MWKTKKEPKYDKYIFPMKEWGEKQSEVAGPCHIVAEKNSRNQSPIKMSNVNPLAKWFDIQYYL